MLTERRRKRRMRTRSSGFPLIYPAHMTTALPDSDEDNKGDSDGEADDAPASSPMGGAAAGAPAMGGGSAMASSWDPLSMAEFQKFLSEIAKP